ncbi:probable serine/threonine-protein kinase nek3 isoform X2 [Astyanax mexicanus]|uniref:probable serine/threonine-protein kinase nek3 isoform X2 n=1 Tax=Astyanax mexicanus TaxID=7994 RepID=UPI0020CB2F08|nr:probable serine/threonine-protein kinase nek3 isoform X2 [Astyanax mexicanus]
MERGRVCVMILVFSECVWGAQSDPCSGRGPVVKEVEKDVLSCSVPNQEGKYSAIGCRSIHSKKGTSCYLIYEDGTECEEQLNFNGTQEVLECEIENRLTPFHVRVKRKSTSTAKEPSGSDKNKIRSSNTSSKTSPSGTSPSKTSPSGTSPSGTSPSGTSPSKTSPSKTSPSGTSPSGTSPSGTSPSKTSPSKTSPSKTSPSGTSPSGTSPSGTSPSDTLQERADSVVIVRDNGDWSEGEQRKLKCEIKNVGPVSNLTVQWTRLDQNQTRTIRESRNFTISSRMEEKGDVTDTLEVWTSPEEDGVQYQCSALLDLIQFKQQQVDESQPFNITVLYKPIITRPSAATVSKTAGDALTFYCSARGKPKPQFTWTTGNSNITHSPLLNISNVQSEHQGNYTCIASNSKGSASVTVTVTVSEDNLPIIASCVAVAVALLIVGLFVWYCKHYRHTHMGRYILRNLASRRHNANVAHCDSQTLQSH